MVYPRIPKVEEGGNSTGPKHVPNVWKEKVGVTLPSYNTLGGQYSNEI